jgi:UDP-GlcNAc:undecaprenyl-phosphate GlcNAc-1-phosphate transferase
VAQPKADRWHKKPTAMLGGAAIFASVVVTYFALVPYTAQSLVIVAASTFLFALGLIDDLYHVKPYQKLIGQVMGAALVISYGLSLPWSESAPVNMGLTIFWLIGITNGITCSIIWTAWRAASRRLLPAFCLQLPRQRAAE